MENNKSTSPKAMKLSSGQSSPPAGGYGRTARSGQAQPFRLQTESRGQMKERALAKKLQEMDAEEARHRIRVAQGLPLTTDKPETIHKPPVKEQTKPMEFKLHTQQRAAQRAGFNDLVAYKFTWQNFQRRQIERLRKIIEEEEVKTLRKEMIPRAQLMPFFDRPFFPQRSSRRLTVPKEPSFYRRNSCSGNAYGFQQPLNQSMKPIQ